MCLSLTLGFRLKFSLVVLYVHLCLPLMIWTRMWLRPTDLPALTWMRTRPLCTFLTKLPSTLLGKRFMGLHVFGVCFGVGVWVDEAGGATVTTVVSDDGWGAGVGF